MPPLLFPSLPPAFQQQLRSAFRSLSEQHLVERLWAMDHRLWKPEPREIEDRLGWLTIMGPMQEQAAELQAFAAAVRGLSVKDVVLLGMGGSSLGPEVLRATFGSSRGFPRLWVLDSTIPGWVRAVTKSIDPAKSLFIVASKSGGTIEVMSLFAHFWSLVANTRGSRGGQHFIAITDPGTELERLAVDHGFWRTFTNQPDIGGRYSVLSYFGMVPAALLGIRVDRLIERAQSMADACRVQAPPENNPGVFLGAVMGMLAQTGRDKVTVIASPSVQSFGLWAEQLLAESTGKEGTGVVPITDEPLLPPKSYGSDRLFVYLRLKGDRNGTLDRQTHALRRAGQPVLQLGLRDRYDLGAEFFRWEFATAVAGHLLQIHPFDQPNVQESKNNTRRVLDEVRAGGKLPSSGEPPDRAAKKIGSLVKPGGYVAILAYTAPSRTIDRAIRSVRKAIASREGVATTAGYGPRYLHSTGQLHKGGPGTGLFLELIDDMTPDLPIPGQPYSFGTLAKAQAAGDLQSLESHGRPAVQVRLGRNPSAVFRTLAAAFKRVKLDGPRQPRMRARAKSR